MLIGSQCVSARLADEKRSGVNDLTASTRNNCDFLHGFGKVKLRIIYPGLFYIVFNSIPLEPMDSKVNFSTCKLFNSSG